MMRIRSPSTWAFLLGTASRSLAFCPTTSTAAATVFPRRSTAATTTLSLASLSSLRMVSSSASVSAAAASTSTSTCSSGSSSSSTNPLLQSWESQPFHLPPFDKIQPSHFEEAFSTAMEAHLKDLQEIVDDDDTTFESVIVQYDRAGSLLDKIAAVFSNLCSSQNTDDLKEVQSKLVPILSRHSSATYFLPGLFAKIDAFMKQVQNGDEKHKLTVEQVRLVERIHMDFTRAGAGFDAETQKQYADLKAKLASLTTEFAQNVMKDEETYEIVLQKADFSGCPDSLVQAAKQAAVDRQKGPNDYVITLSRSLVEPFLTFSDRRDLREQAWRAWSKRGELYPARDNLAIATEILKLRTEQARFHGCKSFAEFACQDRMARTPEKVMELLENVWTRAKESANLERQALENFVEQSGERLEGGVQAWDWRYYATKVRAAKYDFDEALLKPYLSLDKVTEAFFAVSHNLFGLRYIKRDDIELYHPDVETYEVRETLKDGTDRLVALFVHDNFARPFKASGAWMSEYRSQTKNLPDEADPIEAVPVVSNNNNFAKGSGPTLLSFDDATTLFHEGGHGHHGMLSDATYSRLASTSVLTDFVELPSQLMEHWFEQPEVLKKYARHHETGEEIPQELLDRLNAAKSFNQGFETVEFTSAALVDMALHMREDYGEDFDLAAFEESELERLGMPRGIIMRHRPAHFQHLFSTSSYAAGYYVYLWAEVLDADAFGAFAETGNVFDKDVAARVRKYIYSSGNTEAPDELFRLFRGRDPDINFMLEKKGLTATA